MLESGIGRAHNIHLSTLPNFSLPGDVAASRRYYAPGSDRAGDRGRPDGTIAVPDGPGIGVHVVADARRRGDGRNHGVARVTTDVHIGKAVRPRPSIAGGRCRVARSGYRRACRRRRRSCPRRRRFRKQQKMAWILQLEDQRLLRIDLPAPPPPPPPVKGKKPAPVVTPAAAIVFARPVDARARRRRAGAPPRGAGDRPGQVRRLAWRCSTPRWRIPTPTCGRWPRSRSGSSATPRPSRRSLRC